MLNIEFENKTLKIEYTGDLSLPEFIRDFRYGKREFTPHEFPDDQRWLDQMKIRRIVVEYRFQGTGHKQLLTLLDSLSGRIPEDKEIAKIVWNR